MTAHKIETVVPADGTLHLSNLPFAPGAQVEIIVLTREQRAEISEVTFPLRGTPGEMHDPFEPAIDPEEWETL